ncbi:MAG: sugar kinase [Clostridia bacterium]
MDKNIVTFGEIMMRLQPPNCDRIANAKSFEINFGGGEANVAVCLAQLGDNSSFVTKLPNNAVAKACLGELNRWGVNTKDIVWGGERLGVYYCEKGFSLRPSNVIYDRKNSSITQIASGEIDWERILKNAGWFHFTGITAALGEDVLRALKCALGVAQKLGVTVSCDLNYRNKLWSKQTARLVMSELMQYVNVLIANEEDANDVFGIAGKDCNVAEGKLNIEGYTSVITQIEQQFNIHTIAITLRESFSANNNGWQAILYNDNKFFVSKHYDLLVLDRVGGGDAFGAGLIHSFANGYDSDHAINYAVACSSIKHTINGDFNIISHEEVEKLLKGGTSGRVQR